MHLFRVITVYFAMTFHFHMLTTQFTIHTLSHRETVVSNHSKLKKDCKSSQSS